MVIQFGANGLRGKTVRDHSDRAEGYLVPGLLYSERYYKSFLDATITIEWYVYRVEIYSIDCNTVFSTP
jgi:hypothetical protein